MYIYKMFQVLSHGSFIFQFNSFQNMKQMGRKPDIVLLAKETGSYEYIDISVDDEAREGTDDQVGMEYILV